jgi:hypothetical protein
MTRRLLPVELRDEARLNRRSVTELHGITPGIAKT